MTQGDHWLNGLTLPADYRVDERGIWQQVADAKGNVREHHVSHARVLISGRAVDPTDRSTTLKLTFEDADGHWANVAVAREDALGGKLIELASVGFPVDSTRRSRMVAYLSAFEAANRGQIPAVRVARRLGWHGNTFVLGHQVIGDEMYEVEPPDGCDDLFGGLVSRGSRDEWMALVMGEALKHPPVLAGIYASIASVLLELIPEAEPFVFEWAGTTTRGKTTALKAAASVWGDPRLVMRSWDVSRAGAGDVLAASGHLPLFLDDTKVATDNGVIAEVIYEAVSGRSRTRSRGPGGLRRSRRWRNVLMSTGEQPCFSFGQDGGTRPRCLIITSSPLVGDQEVTRNAAVRINELVQQHHGFLGPEVIRLLQRDPDVEWSDRYHGVRSWWASLRADSPIAHRVANHFALMEIAGELVRAVTNLEQNPRQVLRPIWEEAAAGFDDVEPSVRALRMIRSWMVEHESQFHSRNSGRSPRWAGAWPAGKDWSYVAILQTRLKSALEPEFSYRATLDAWREAGWLDTGTDRPGKWVQVGQGRHRCIVIRRRAFREVGGDDDEEDGLVPREVTTSTTNSTASPRTLSGARLAGKPRSG